MDAAAFEVYVSKCRVPQLWKGAVVVMDNSDLAAFSISPIGQRFEDNFKPSLGRNFGTALDGFEQLEPDNRGEQYL